VEEEEEEEDGTSGAGGEQRGVKNRKIEEVKGEESEKSLVCKGVGAECVCGGGGYVSVSVGEMSRQGLVSGLLSDSGVNNTLRVCVCVLGKQESIVEGWSSVRLGGGGCAPPCLWHAP